jgi:hypothetical protein
MGSSATLTTAPEGRWDAGTLGRWDAGTRLRRSYPLLVATPRAIAPPQVCSAGRRLLNAATATFEAELADRLASAASPRALQPLSDTLTRLRLANNRAKHRESDLVNARPDRHCDNGFSTGSRYRCCEPNHGSAPQRHGRQRRQRPRGALGCTRESVPFRHVSAASLTGILVRSWFGTPGAWRPEPARRVRVAQARRWAI